MTITTITCRRCGAKIRLTYNKGKFETPTYCPKCDIYFEQSPVAIIYTSDEKCSIDLVV